jgi:hypothetical protein
MHHTETLLQTGLQTFKRNRFYHGKMLDVFHLELETNYFNAKRWLINRLVCGYGVVCGLNVLAGPGIDQVRIEPGVAIDQCGHEIIVPCRTAPIPIPSDLYKRVEKPGQETRPYSPKQEEEEEEEEEERCVQVLICYHECLTDPVPVLLGDCATYEPCTPGIIREQYRIEFREGCAEHVDQDCQIPDLFHGRNLDYGAMARWITESCPDVPEDCCIPLANVHIRSDGKCHSGDQDNIDITIRPIVYSNDLLYELIKALAEEAPGRGPWKK